MKEVTVPRFEAFDGELFSNKEECLAYEKASFHKLFVGLTEVDVAAGLKRENEALADAFELAGKVVTKARLEAGLRKRAPTRGRAKTAEPEPA